MYHVNREWCDEQQPNGDAMDAFLHGDVAEILLNINSFDILVTWLQLLNINSFYI